MEEGNCAQIADKQALYELVVKYCRAIDRCDEDLFLSVFHDDALLDPGHTFAGTPKEFVEYLNSAGRWSPGKRERRIQHAVSNSLFDVVGDVAYGETYVEVREIVDGERFAVVARYIDRYERRGGDWRIARRRVVRDFLVPSDERAFPPSAPVGGSRDLGDPSYERD
jgi:SnoaL-like domain